MQPTQNPESDRTVEVEPAIRHTVAWRVTSVAPLGNFRLLVSFVDGTGARWMRLYGARDSIKELGKRLQRDPSVVSRLYSAYATARDQKLEKALLRQLRS